MTQNLIELFKCCNISMRWVAEDRLGRVTDFACLKCACVCEREYVFWGERESGRKREREKESERECHEGESCTFPIRTFEILDTQSRCGCIVSHDDDILHLWGKNSVEKSQWEKEQVKSALDNMNNASKVAEWNHGECYKSFIVIIFKGPVY